MTTMTENASGLREFKMPDVGEGLTEAEILKWYVQPGDTVTDGQVVCEVETAKAAVELPIPYDGVVRELRFPEGTTVDVGQVIIAVDVAGGAAPVQSAPRWPRPPSPPRDPAVPGGSRRGGAQVRGPQAGPRRLRRGGVLHQATPPQGRRGPPQQSEVFHAATAIQGELNGHGRPRPLAKPRSASSPRTSGST